MKNLSIPLLFLFVLLTSCIPVHALTSNVEVGVYYYLWYDLSNPVSWEYPKIHDKPVLDFYNSSDPEIIKQHFAWMSELHIDFAILSWWGINTFTDNASKEVFATAKQNVTNVKLCIMIEPFNETGTYNYTQLYDYIYGTFVSAYPTVYYKYFGSAESSTFQLKPLLLFFNAPQLTPNGIFPRDSRFIIIISGNAPYAEWIYEDVKPDKPAAPVPRQRQISVLPRYDDYYVRSPNYTIDSKLEYLYEEQWARAIEYSSNHSVDIVTITSWNEYPERTAIEPHYDSTAADRDPYLLFSKTQDYIAQLKGISTQASEIWYENPRIYIIICGVTIFIAIIGKYMYEKT